MANKRYGKNRSSTSRPPKQSPGKRAAGVVTREQTAGPGLDSAGAIDFEKLATVRTAELNLTGFRATAAIPPAPPEPGQACLEEIADDMLGLMKQVKAVQDDLSALLARVEQMEQRVVACSNTQVRELDKLKRDLLGERKALAARTTLEAVAPWMDSLREMRDRMTSQKDARLRCQVDAIVDRTAMMLHVLGFEEFNVGEGEAFDPACMECVGYAEGKSGVVLKARRPGYCAGGKIVRPAGVVIANPRCGDSALTESTTDL